MIEIINELGLVAHFCLIQVGIRMADCFLPYGQFCHLRSSRIRYFFGGRAATLGQKWRRYLVYRSIWKSHSDVHVLSDIDNRFGIFKADKEPQQQVRMVHGEESDEED